MIYVLLGVIIGLALAILMVVLVPLFKTRAERAISQLQSSLGQKGKIIEPESSDLKDFLDNLPSNDSTL